MFRASIYPSSGILGCIQPTNAQFSFTVLNTICGSIIRIQPNTPEDGHI